jgi:hypothetical protein
MLSIMLELEDVIAVWARRELKRNKENVGAPCNVTGEIKGCTVREDLRRDEGEIL